MNKTFTISEAKEMVGMTIPRMELLVGQVYIRKTGEGQYGPWSLQNALVKDETGEIKLVFDKLPDQKGLVGKKLIFKSMPGKHGINGIKVKKEEFEGKERIEIWVSRVALIVSAQEEPNVSAVTPSIRLPQNEPQTPSEPKISHDDRKLGIATVKNRLTQLAGLYEICWNAAESIGERRGEQEPTIVKDIASCLFIQSVREGLSDKMPIRTVEKFYAEEKPCDLEDDDIPY